MDYGYFDTSALIKRYIEELGRREVLKLLRKHNCAFPAVLPVEVRSALRRRVRDKTLDAKRVPADPEALSRRSRVLDGYRGFGGGAGDRRNSDRRASAASARCHSRG